MGHQLVDGMEYGSGYYYVKLEFVMENKKVGD